MNFILAYTPIYYQSMYVYIINRLFSAFSSSQLAPQKLAFSAVQTAGSSRCAPRIRRAPAIGACGLKAGTGGRAELGSFYGGFKASGHCPQTATMQKKMVDSAVKARGIAVRDAE